MEIALDAMGGDHAPGPIVAGAVQAVAANPELRVVLVGDRAQVEPHLGGTPERVELFHCTQAIAMEETPVLAFLKNVRRPGIAAVMPTLRGPCVILDVGANVSPKPEHLFQYGIMGNIFVKHMFQRDRPTIGLMNVGSEEQKGHDLAKETHVLFNQSHLREQFIGNIEGRDIHRGACDVVVTDGFVGNVVLKVCEGVFDFVMKMAGKELLSTLVHEKAQAQKALQTLVDRYDYSSHGGAPLLGIDGICIICHGSSGDQAIKNALHVAARYASSKLNDIIVQELES